MDFVSILILLLVLIISYIYFIIFYFRNRIKIKENNGNIISEENKLCGVYYNEKGEVDHIYVKGKADIRVRFSDKGRIQSLESSNGKNKSLYYDDEGKLEKEGFRTNHEKTGEWNHYYYDEDGRMDSKTIYDKGIIIEKNFYNREGEHTKYICEDGLEKKGFKYNKDGELMEEIDFYDDKKIVTEFFGSDTVVTKYKGVTVGEGKTKMRSYLFIPDSVERHKKSKKKD